MRTWQLFIIIRPVTNLATVFIIPTNLTNAHFMFMHLIKHAPGITLKVTQLKIFDEINYYNYPQFKHPGKL